MFFPNNHCNKYYPVIALIFPLQETANNRYLSLCLNQGLRTSFLLQLLINWLGHVERI